MEKLVLSKFTFKHWTVANLSLSASVNFLNQLIIPVIDESYLIAVAELVEGNPLALKIIGRLLDLYGKHDMRKQLSQNPLHVLDSASVKKERFRSILDVAFARLGELKECGYVLGLFPGSFDKNAGTRVTSSECFEVYRKHSLLDEYRLAHHYRYKMHRLIREYVKEKINKNDEIGFNKLFEEHYLEPLLEYAIKCGLSTDERYSLSLETRNFDHLIRPLLLQDQQLSEKQLAILAFLATKNYLKSEEYFSMSHNIIFMDKLSDICKFLCPATCGGFYSYIINNTYQNCKCETLIEYVQDIFHCQCNSAFQCTVVDQIADLCKDARYNTLCAQLPYRVKAYIDHIGEHCYHCANYLHQYNLISLLNICVISIVFVLWLVLLKRDIALLACLPLLYLSASIIFQVSGFAYDILLYLFMYSEMNSLLFQTICWKVCTLTTTILILYILLVGARKVYHMIKKELTINSIVSYLFITFLGLFIVLVICEIQLFVCQFLPVCIV